MSLGKSLGIGAAGSLGIMAFGIPALWPLGIIVAAITHAATQGTRRMDDEETNSAQESEYSTNYCDNGRQSSWAASAELPEQRSLDEQSGRIEHTGQVPRRMRGGLQRRNTDFLHGLETMANPIESLRRQAGEQDNEGREDVMSDRQLRRPSLVNEAYFRRHGRD